MASADEARSQPTGSAADRRSTMERNTHETKIRVELDLDARPNGAAAEPAATGHGFLDHLLAQLAKHGRFALAVTGQGDLHIDVHHLAEDCGIVIGQALSEALGDRAGIERYGTAHVPMDETLAHVVVDLSGRPFLAFDPAGFAGDSGGFNAFHLRELLRGFANHAGATVHVRVLAGEETHHVCEAVMKAFARALKDAVARTHDQLPSTKGLL
ncbi:MAG TPA: imidazoleglycerol-phosphate dehydratase HisB [Trueperaceae bacterium]|nr:imidazoleglycerol-phosphate dehydratase HisB [Trueperaceae bacterium]